ncbi:MAG TPA: NAD-dependent epimerase/dehydratase family protein, partial [Sulfitobacter sp.]|nr:NAD-dependent epimerase/dehydratase family protein [Sulfitobacter sp.]
VRNLKRGAKIFAHNNGEPYRNWLHVDDTVRAILQTLVVPEAVGNIINIASGKPVSIREMIEKTCLLSGSGKPLRRGPNATRA